MGYIILSIFIFILDIMTKMVADLNLKQIGTIPLIQDIFHLTYVENKGIAFGMFAEERLLFILVSIGVLVILSVLYTKTQPRT